MIIRVAGAQLAVTRDVPSNVQAISRAIDFAGDERADILLTPEGSLSGYTPEFNEQAVRDALGTIVEKAIVAGVGLALGTCFVEPEDQRCYNQVRFYQAGGKHLGFHSKMLTCGTLDDPPKGEIEHYAVSPLRTFDFKGTTIGALICNDLWANPGCTPMPDPHLSQRLANMGARVVFHAVNGGRNGSEWSKLAWRYHGSNLRMRARAGHIWIVTVDSCCPTDLPCSSPSGVIDPEGDWVCRTEAKGEQYFAHTIHLPEDDRRLEADE